MKKLLATILALVMALGLCSVSWAAETVTVMNESDLKKAIDAGGAVTLGDDITVTTTLSVTKDLEVNLNNHTLTGAGSVILVQGAKLVVNGPGTIKEKNPDYGAIAVKGSNKAEDMNYTTVEVNKDVVLEAWAPIFVTPYQSSGAPYAYGVTITVNGATLNAKKDSGAAGGTGVYVNGQITHTENAPVINLTDTTIYDSDNASEGMYLAGYARTTLTGCTITGTTGVEIRAGELTVNGGSITGTATPIGEAPNGNGSTVTGAGIAVSQHTTMLPLTVTVNGSNVKGYSAFYQVDTLAEMGDDAGNKKFTEEQVAAAVAKITLSVNKGVYTATGEDGQAVYSENKTGFVSGGTFSNSVNPTYLADGLNYEVHTNEGYVYYSDVTTAVAAAQANNAEVNTPGAEGGPFVIVWDYGYDGISVKVNSATGKIDPPELKRSGYTFKGWRVNGSNEVYTNDDISRMEVDREGKTFTAVWSSNSYYYYPSTTTDTKTDSPKTLDAGVGIYAVTAVLSVTGMAWTAKKRH